MLVCLSMERELTYYISVWLVGVVCVASKLLFGTLYRLRKYLKDAKMLLGVVIVSGAVKGHAELLPPSSSSHVLPCVPSSLHCSLHLSTLSASCNDKGGYCLLRADYHPASFKQVSCLATVRVLSAS